jgi:predicted nucleic acid-binding protein
MDVLVDTSIWIDHLHRHDAGLAALLQAARVVMHPAVLGELACGNIPKRQEFLSLWIALPRAVEISSAEALDLIEDRRLWGRGLGWTDVHLLGSALLSGVRLWTRDRPLQQIADQLRISLRGAAP